MKKIYIVYGVNHEIMKYKKNNAKEILLQFKQTHNPKELDEMIYNFEKDMNEINNSYFLKESEDPFIYFLEYGQPDELIKRLKIKEEYNLIPVTCVISNMNYITSTILRKIRHKLGYKDTFGINCFINTYCLSQSKENIENEISERIENIIKIENDKSHPVWTINLYVVGDITAINIVYKRNNKELSPNYL